MANLHPFQPYRYSSKAGPLETLVTQPYDKISPAMQTRYLSLNPHNLVRVILGERFPSDTDQNNVYTRAAQYLNDWIRDGILVQEDRPSFYAYSQEFTLPDSDEKLRRQGLIGLCALEEYQKGVVHRHEQTLTGPKKDRTELLNHTRAHFGQIFMLYPDPELAVDRLLEQAARNAPSATVTDEYGTIHRVWKIADSKLTSKIQQLMSDKKLLIADGHHRYETALAFKNANPRVADASKVMMTFVNMHSPGLKILATHRLVNGLDGFEASAFLGKVQTRPLASIEELKALFAKPAPEKVRIGIAIAGSPHIRLYERNRGPGELDIKVLHDYLLGQVLGIGEEAVREEKHLEYVRGVDAAYDKIRSGSAQIGFLLEPTTVQQVADVAFSGGVMPQKSTDFYPKLLTGLTIYKLEK
ncbi:MAG: DUF1015 domain-containing protein [Bryobacteraceae bacterium]